MNIEVKAISEWIGYPEQYVAEKAPRKVMTEREAMITAMAVVLDITYDYAQKLYYKYNKYKLCKE